MLKGAHFTEITDFLPESRQFLTRLFPAALPVTIRHHDSVHCTGAGAADAFDFNARVFKKPVKNAPCISPMRAAALQREVNFAGQTF